MEFIKKHFWHIVNSLVIALLLVLFVNSNILNTKHKSKVVYIDNIKVFNDFNMTKDLTQQNESKHKAQIQEFEDLVNEIKTMETELQKLSTIPEQKKLAYAKLQKTVVEKDRELQQLQQQVKSDISSQVWKRLNSYIDEFGKTHNIDIILGAQGQGNIMYGKENTDLTYDFIKYANHKYEGN